jgi:hypothetical protein
LLRFILALACFATPGAAEGWKVMYLADSGGSRPMQVGPNDGGTPFAYVENEKGERLFLDCRWSGGAASDYDWTLKLYPGQPPNFLPKAAQDNQFLVTFDGVDTTYGIADFTFVQEAFWGPTTDIMVDDIRTRSLLRLEMPAAFVEGGTTYRTEFTLSGSKAAINKACPPL